MWNIPQQSRLDKIPRLYETESVPVQDKLIYLHFFIGGSDWFAAEFDGDDTFFGYVVLNGDYQCAEWGYFSFSELKEVKVAGWCEVDCELEADLAAPGKTDKLTDTIDYVAVYNCIKEVVEGKAFSLVESLATTLADIILEKFPIYRVTLKVRKKIPPIAGTIEHIEIEVTRRQPDASKIISDNKE